MNKTYYLITYGCQMNKSDSERIVSVLEKNNFKKATLVKTDLVILNLCSVRQSAVDRVWGKINYIKTLKHKNIKTKIILTGCILNEDKKKFKNKVDYILDINNLSNWPFITKIQDKNYLCIPPTYSSKCMAYVPIMTGCDNYCSYCVVPYARGREKSLPVKKILKQVKSLINKNYKFIILLGQNINSYSDDQINFPKLLKKIDAIPGNYWLSFTTSHPKDLSNELINCFTECQHLIPYLHLPIQSGSDKILKAMNRHYTVNKYIKLVKRVKQVKPNINLSTDIIVGFPRETEVDFQKTAELMKGIKFDMAYIAQYSPRPGTAAAKLVDNVPKTEKKCREKVLTKILKKTALENNKKLINKKIEVLIERRNEALPRSTEYFGKTRNFKNIKLVTPTFRSDKDLIGKFVNVKITNTGPWGLEGKLAS